MGLRRSSAGRLLQAYACTLCVLAIAVGAAAQVVLVPSPTLPSPQEQPAPETVDTNLIGSATAGPAAPLIPSNRQPFQWGPIILHPHLAYQFLYGNGILSQPGQTQKTALNQISPGIGFDIGRRWKLDYTPSILLYSDPSFRDTVNHSINLVGATASDDWTLRLSQNCALTSDPQVQTAQQTDQQQYLTLFQAMYQVKSGTSLELDARQYFQFLENVTNSVGNSRDWSALGWLDRQWGPHLGAGVGLGAGYVHVEVGSDMTYEQVQGRVTSHVAQKLDLSVNGGVDFRQFIDSTQPALVSPIFGASIKYQPFEATTISLNANRNVSASYFENFVTEFAEVNGSVYQRFFKILYLGVSGGYTHTIYRTSGTVDPNDPSVGRVDDYSFFSVSLNTVFLKRGTASVFYSASQNSSNRAGYSYNSDQIGFQLAYRY
jgi:hypothetical protein